MRFQTIGNITVARFRLLETQADVSHFVSCRAGGVSPPPWDTLNISHTVGDSPARVEKNRSLLARTLGMRTKQLRFCAQRHGTDIWVVSERERICPDEPLREADGMITAQPGVCLTVVVADCAPVLLWSTSKRVAGVFHAGWRGLAGGICEKAVDTMRVLFRAAPYEMIACVGPCIGACCYRVDAQVIEAMEPHLCRTPHALVARGGGFYLDLSAIAAGQLLSAGVPEAHIEEAGVCTSCRQDLFFSHRGSGGRTGRCAAGIAIEG